VHIHEITYIKQQKEIQKLEKEENFSRDKNVKSLVVWTIKKD